MMTKKYTILLTLVVITLALLLSGCAAGSEDLSGMYIATFELNGGTLDFRTSTVSSKINYAYEPGSYIIDPANYANYEISRAGYVFTGWYKTAECKESDKWDFTTGKIDSEKLTLYAGWEKEIVYSYVVSYKDGDNTVDLGTYKVSPGAVFEDYRNNAGKRDGYTAIGYYSDPECTTPWDFDFVHPGGETDNQIRIYVDYIVGDWKLVDTYEKLKNAMGQGNIYLTADIDCNGADLYFKGTFSGIFQGNGYTISNFKVTKAGGSLMPTVSVFQTLGEGAKIDNVKFENVTFELLDVDKANKIKVAALAREANGATVTNVTVKGKLVTNYNGELERLNEAFYDENSTGEVTGFTADITVEKQS